MPLLISPRILSAIKRAARETGTSERVGILASPPGVEAVTDDDFLDSKASGSTAAAGPLAVRQTAVEIASRSLRPRGVGRRRGALGVFHSRTALKRRPLPGRVPLAAGPGCSTARALEPPPGAWAAAMYWLVVNACGDGEARAFLFADRDGLTFSRLEPREVREASGASKGAGPSGRFLAADGR